MLVTRPPIFWKGLVIMANNTEVKEFTKVDERLRHIAFIMDGNGRWATKRGMPREMGHKYGAAKLKDILKHCKEIGIKVVTVYAFSTENWKRPESEVNALMSLFNSYLDEALKEFANYDIKLKFIGDMSRFNDSLREKIEAAEKETENNSLILNIAVNYGGRSEITAAFNKLASEGKTNITENDISSAIYTAGCPDPDMIVRTGGDMRISNFLLWQAAYSELYFTDTLWPDMSAKVIDEAVKAFYSRKRRYGGL